MGLSQAKLGDLVGRSPSTIRSWERDESTPNDPDVLKALAAVLGVEQRTLFEKARVDRPELETSPTLEQELASLRPPLAEDEEASVEISFTYEELAGLGVALGHDQVPAPVADEVIIEAISDDDFTEGELPEEETPEEEVTPQEITVQEVTEEGDHPAPAESNFERPAREDDRPSPAFVEPGAPYVVTRIAPNRLEPAYAEPSYLEDRSERQLYRVRTVATAVGVVVMLLLLMYALSKGLESFGEWWESFFGQLRL